MLFEIEQRDSVNELEIHLGDSGFSAKTTKGFWLPKKNAEAISYDTQTFHERSAKVNG